MDFLLCLLGSQPSSAFFFSHDNILNIVNDFAFLLQSLYMFIVKNLENTDWQKGTERIIN